MYGAQGCFSITDKSVEIAPASGDEAICLREGCVVLDLLRGVERIIDFDAI
jgi:hypothetical protein